MKICLWISPIYRSATFMINNFFSQLYDMRNVLLIIKQQQEDTGKSCCCMQLLILFSKAVKVCFNICQPFYCLCAYTVLAKLYEKQNPNIIQLYTMSIKVKTNTAQVLQRVSLKSPMLTGSPINMSAYILLYKINNK